MTRGRKQDEVIESLYAALTLLRKHKVITNAPSNDVAARIRKLGNESALKNWKGQGRKPALDWEQVERARWLYANTSCSMERIARHLRVSQGVIQDVIDKKGAYAETEAVSQRVKPD